MATEVLLSEIVAKLLADGLAPREVRRRLAAEGIRWSYQFSASKYGRRVSSQSTRERQRRTARTNQPIPAESPEN